MTPKSTLSKALLTAFLFIFSSGGYACANFKPSVKTEGACLVVDIIRDNNFDISGCLRLTPELAVAVDEALEVDE